MSDFEEKVLDLLEGITKKLDDVLGKLEGSIPASASKAASEHVLGGRRPSDLVEMQEEEEREQERPPVEGRRTCPKCNGTDFRTEEDKTRLLHSMGGVKIYAKKYICKKCGEITF